ncbi:ABC transporter permease [Actinoplanes sp. NBRC 14428]|uniref:ABC-2 family transporter n=1 Tax=Pseudosporangium ferrugineum TaxID=439699 RepID=A0A2T0RMC4_9ACTN|nr:ABC transporter permease [Pseudosporangium ferrugineum]PRY22339.1 hypothetical protein CLV70_11742 [Pseudosporangium ferrugineum]BCJ52510.1 ABC transporter permease [Actinoplanes sp. NBRC 14428]
MRILRSEWTKLRSVRSIWITILSTVAAGTALSALGVSDLLGGSPADLPDPWDPTATSLKGFLFAQLLIGMLGALSITPEYATGMIGTSLSHVPARSRLLAAKATVITAIALVTSLVTALLSFTVVQALFAGADLPSAGLTDPGVPRALTSATLYLTLIALIGVAVGTLTRSTTGSLAVLVGGLLLVPAIAPGLPGGLGDWFGDYWPNTAGQAAYAVIRTEGMIAPGTGLAVLTLTALCIAAASHLAFRVRDI